MATLHICDICGEQMSNLPTDRVHIGIFPDIGIRSISDNNKPYSLNIECCESCAEYVYNMIQTRKELKSQLHERNNDGTNAINTEE